MYRLILLLSFLIISFSCSSKKNIIYLQDFDSESNYSNQYKEYTVKTDDILKIYVSSQVPETASIFNLNSTTSSVNSNKDSMLYSGFQIDAKGNINFPILGKVRVVGKTVDEIRRLLYDLIVKEGQLTDPVIDVKILNTYFIVLGEVNKPGRYEYLKNNINILEAIGIAGDLTINGKRNDIKLIREIDGERKISSIDLTNSELFSDRYQIFSGDIIIVNQNTNRVKSAGIIGNSGTLLSLLSFILSLVIVTSNT